MPKKREVAVRYWECVDRRSPDECWPWTGNVDNEGYGVLSHTKPHLAHRIGYLLLHGSLPKVVRHTCDVPACQNPDHWLAGTQADNCRDRDERGRTAKHEQNGRAKLTLEIVEAARAAHAAGQSQRSLARQYGVTAPAMRFAILGRTWK